MTTSVERKWASAAHWLPVVVGAFTSGLLGWAVTLGIYLSQRRRSQFVGFHAYQSLFFQFALAVFCLAGILLSPLGIGKIMLWIALPGGILIPIIAAIRASQGEWWRNPILGGRQRSLRS